MGTSAPAVTSFAVDMVQDKETSGTIRFADPTDGSVLPTVYVRKDAFPDGVYPETIHIRVTVTF